MSEGELYETSKEEETEFLQMALESVYVCSPLKSAREPAKILSWINFKMTLGNYLSSPLKLPDYPFFWLLDHESTYIWDNHEN